MKAKWFSNYTRGKDILSSNTCVELETLAKMFLWLADILSLKTVDFIYYPEINARDILTRSLSNFIVCEYYSGVKHTHNFKCLKNSSNICIYF